MPDNQSHSPSAPEAPVNEGAKARLTKKIQSLDDPTCAVLETIVAGLSARFVEVIDSDTDIVTEPFAKNFRIRLQLHHATHEEVFKKKTFEFAFKAASIVAGRTAEMDEDVTSAGYDLKVDDVRFSLKTEAGKTTSGTHIKISKLMEARWIRECRTGQDYLALKRQTQPNSFCRTNRRALSTCRAGPLVRRRHPQWSPQSTAAPSSVSAKTLGSDFVACVSCLG